MLTKPRTVLVLTGIFVAGAVSGVFLAPVLRFHAHAPMQPRPFQERNMERLEQALELNSEQRTKVAELMRQTGLEFEKRRRAAWIDNTKLIDDLNAKISAVLTPEQRVKFEAFRKAQLERLFRRMDARDPRHRFGPGERRPRGQMPRDDGRPDELPPPPPEGMPPVGGPPPPDMQPGEPEPPPVEAPQN